MKLKLTNAFKQAAGLGIIAGMRTFAAPIVLSHVYSSHPAKQLKSTSFSFLQYAYIQSIKGFGCGRVNR